MSGSPDLTVALAPKERFADCRALWLTLRDHHGEGNPELGPLHDDDASWEIAHRLYGGYLDEDGAFLVLATDGDDPTPLGCAVVTVNGGSPTWRDPARFGYLELLAVDPAQRGLGVGTRIVDAIQGELDRQEAGDLRLTAMSGNLGAQAFYASLGFTTYAVELRRPSPPPAAS
jgi:ribosomal protein S18 acetylase RimI-like enzyme